MTQPVRSFNLNKLASNVGYEEGFYTLSSANSCRIDYGSGEHLRLGPQFCLETRIKFDEVAISGVFTAFSVYDVTDRIKLTIESGLAVKVYSNTATNEIMSYEGLTAGVSHHLALQVYDSSFFLYIDGTLESTLPINLSNLYSTSKKPSAYSSAIGIDGKMKYVRLWSTPQFAWMINRGAIYDTPAYPRSVLIGGWEFGNTSKNIVPDTSNYGNYGSITTHTDVTKNYEYENDISPAWKHDMGKPAYINFSTFRDYMQNKDDALTIEGWVYVEDSVVANFRLIEFDATLGNSSPSYMELSTGNVLLGLVRDRSANTPLVFDTGFPLDQWVHVGMTWASKDTDMCMYVNNVKTTATVASSDSIDMTTLSGVIFGNFGNNVGMVRNWRVYHKKLTDSEMESAYKYPTEYPVSERYVVAEWKFTEEETGWAYDCSDNGNYLYPTSISGVSNDKWTCEENSGFYPLMWDGYSYVTSAASIYATHIVSTADANLAVHDNLVFEALFFQAYDNDRYTAGGVVDGGAPSIEAYPAGITYGPHVQLNQPDNSIRYRQYYSGIDLGTQSSIDDIYPRQNIHGTTDKFYANDGKWHHVIAMRSNEWAVSGTDYNYAVYHNGKLRALDNLPDRELMTPLNTGKLVWGHYLNGAVSFARMYAPTTSGMEYWFNGYNVWMSPIQAATGEGNIIEPNLLFDSYLDEANQKVLNIAPGYENSYNLNTSYDDVRVSRVPLAWNYYSVGGTSPRVPSPKYAITQFEADDAYTLEFTYRTNDSSITEQLYVVDAGVQKLYVMSGLYYAHVTPTIIASGINTYNVWHKAVFRYSGETASFLFDGAEIYSGVSTNWSAPGGTTKYGFYANQPLLHDRVDVKRIAAYNVWLDENKLITDRGEMIIDMPLRENLYNF